MAEGESATFDLLPLANAGISKCEFWGRDKMITRKTRKRIAKAVTRAKVYSITNTEILKQIPIISWKLLEQSQKRV